MGGFLLHKGSVPSQVLCPTRFQFLVEAGAIDFPLISSREIADKSRTHPLFAVIVFVQVGWFTVQIISRIAYHLPVTQLEVVTALLLIFHVPILFFWWSKPLDTRDQYRVDLHTDMDEGALQTFLDAAGYNLPPEKCDLRREKLNGRTLKRTVISESPFPLTEPVTNATLRPLTWVLSVTTHYSALAFRSNANAVPNGDLAVPIFYSPDSTGLFKCFWVVVGAALLGIAHLLLGHHFVTRREEKIWRIASIISASASAGILLSFVFIIAVFVIEFSVRGRDVDDPHAMFCALGLVAWNLCLGAVIISRGILIVESFLSLRSLPPGALQDVRWTNYIAHLS